MMKQIKVLSRCTPDAKQSFVSYLQNSLGRNVAVIGDGTNDAPAMEEAKVSFAMAVSGTDVAKSAADMLLVRDHFGDTMSAIHEAKAIGSKVNMYINFSMT